jgi:hypothetical protein
MHKTVTFLSTYLRLRFVDAHAFQLTNGSFENTNGTLLAMETVWMSFPPVRRQFRGGRRLTAWPRRGSRTEPLEHPGGER